MTLSTLLTRSSIFLIFSSLDYLSRIVDDIICWFWIPFMLQLFLRFLYNPLKMFVSSIRSYRRFYVSSNNYFCILIYISLFSNRKDLLTSSSYFYFQVISVCFEILSSLEFRVSIRVLFNDLRLFWCDYSS